MIRKKLKEILCISVLLFLITSCTSVKNMYYMKDISANINSVDSIKLLAIPKIENGDRVSIIVSCADPSQTNFLNPFNSQNPGVNGTQSGIGYLVDSTGNIDFPLIGKVKLSGLNSQEAGNKIKEGLKTIFKDPYVYVTLAGKVFIINGRGGYSVFMNNERLTIFEALAQQGSYEPDDRWDEVLIVREKEGKRTTAFLDLTSKEILNSPYYYLQNNDLVYVKPGKLNATMRSTSAIRSTVGLTTGILALILLLIKK